MSFCLEQADGEGDSGPGTAMTFPSESNTIVYNIGTQKMLEYRYVMWNRNKFGDIEISADLLVLIMCT